MLEKPSGFVLQKQLCRHVFQGHVISNVKSADLSCSSESHNEQDQQSQQLQGKGAQVEEGSCQLSAQKPSAAAAGHNQNEPPCPEATCPTQPKHKQVLQESHARVRPTGTMHTLPLTGGLWLLSYALRYRSSSYQLSYDS